MHHVDAYCNVTQDSFYAASPRLEVFPSFVLVVGSHPGDMSLCLISVM